MRTISVLISMPVSANTATVTQYRGLARVKVYSGGMKKKFNAEALRTEASRAGPRRPWRATAITPTR